jgi:hypothetical protein
MEILQLPLKLHTWTLNCTALNGWIVKVKVTLQLTVSQWVILSVERRLGAYDQIFIARWQLRSYFSEVPSLTRGRVCLLYILLALAIVVFQVRVSWDSWSYFTVSYLRLPFSSPPTTRRVTVEVFEPASTRVWLNRTRSAQSYSLEADLDQTPLASPLLLLCDVTGHAYAVGAT